MPRRKRQRREYAHQGSDMWEDELTGATFFREPGWKPSTEPDVNYPHPRKWRKVTENW
jgi:hypothetical protein